VSVQWLRPTVIGGTAGRLPKWSIRCSAVPGVVVQLKRAAANLAGADLERPRLGDGACIRLHAENVTSYGTAACVVRSERLQPVAGPL
jgi:hypothetical protein